MLDRTQAPPSQTIEDFIFQKAQGHAMPNGIPFFSLKSTQEEVIGLQVLCKGGKYYQAGKGVASFTANLMSSGTKKRGAHQNAEFFDRHGAFLEFTPGTEYISSELFVLKKFLPDVIGAFRELLTEAVYPEAELENYRARRIQAHRQDLLRNASTARAKIRQMLFGPEHPYGYIIEENDFVAISRRQILGHFEENIKQKSCLILATGHIEEREEELIRETFNDFSYEGKTGAARQAAATSPERVFHKEMPEAVQTSIRIGRGLFDKKHPDFIKFQVLNEILGGYFGSRLMGNLREDKGLTYGVASSISTFPDTGYFVIASDVIKEKKDLALEEIYKEINILKNTKVGDEELKTVKNYMAGSFLMSANSPFSLTSHFKARYLNDLGEDYFDTYISKIQAVTAQDVLEMANKYFEHDFHQVTVG